MATTVGNAYLQIVPVSKGIQGAITDSINGAAGNAGTSAGKSIISKLVPSFGEAGASGAKLLGGKLIAAMGALGVGAAVGKVISQGIAEGAQLEQSLGGVEAIFGDEAAEIVKKNAANAFASVGVSANEYMQGVTSFSAALIRDMGGDTKAAAAIADMAFQDMGDNANRFGKSVEDIQTVYSGLAKGQFQLLDNLSLGFAGSKEGMQDLLKYAGELDGVEYSIDSLADMYTAIHRVQQELNVTGTTAKEAATTIEGSKNAMKAAWKDLLGNMAVGGDVKTALSNLGTTVSDYLMGNLLPMIFRIVGSLPGALVTGVIQIGANIIAALPGVLAQLVTGLVSMVVGLKDALLGAAPIIIDGFTRLWTNAKDIFNSIDWPTVGKTVITYINQGITLLFTTIPNKIKEIGTKAHEWFKSIDWLSLGTSVVNFIKTGLQQLFSTVPGKVKEIGSKAWEWFNSVNWGQLAFNLINKIVVGLVNLWLTVPSKLLEIGRVAADYFKKVDWLGLGKTLITKIVSGITSLVTSIPSALTSIAGKAKTAFSNIDWYSVGSSIVSGIIRGITGMAGSLFSSLRDLASNALDAAKAKLGINSPSKVFANIVGRAIPEGIAYGVDKYSDYAIDAVDRLEYSLGTDIGTNVNIGNRGLSLAANSGLTEPIYQIVVQAEIDGTELKTTVADFTINKISNDQLMLMRAQGYGI